MLDGMISEENTQASIRKGSSRKKNTALHQIQETLDEFQEDLGDGLILQMMNLIKTIM